jgi:hypothetical protein
MDVPVVGVGVQPGVPDHVVRVEPDASEEGREGFAQKVLGLDPVVDVPLAVAFLEGHHAVPDAGLRPAQGLSQLLHLRFGHDAFGGEDAARFLPVPGVVEVVDLPVDLDAFLHVVQVVVPFGRGVEPAAFRSRLVVMRPNQHVWRCHRPPSPPFSSSPDAPAGRRRFRP